MNKGLMKGLPKNPTDLEEPWPICILTNPTKILRCINIDVLNFPPRFTIKTDFGFLNAEIIRGFNSTSVAIFLPLHTPFGFYPEEK